MPTARRCWARRRWAWIVLVLVVVFHPLLLGAIGRFLTVDSSIEAQDAVVILGGDHRLQVVADLHSRGLVKSVWLTQEPPDYLERNGLLPRGWEVAHNELVAAGIPPTQIELLEGEASDVTDVARIVKARLEQSPQARVLVVCRGLEGRHLRFVFGDVLGDRLSSQVQIRGLPYEGFDVARWWHCRSGWKEVLSQLCSLGFTVLAGTEPRDNPGPMDPDAFERQLKQNFGDAACYEF